MNPLCMSEWILPAAYKRENMFLCFVQTIQTYKHTNIQTYKHTNIQTYNINERTKKRINTCGADVSKGITHDRVSFSPVTLLLLI